jgi:hypothetical protein
MEDRTIGAWLISHTKKLQEVTNTHEFEDIELAGKCGIFLSNLAASNEQSNLEGEKVRAITRVSGIKKTEIETIKSKLKDLSLIDIGKNGSISVLGITSATVLKHTASIFNESEPNNYQKASLTLSEYVSEFPMNDKNLKEYISDTYELPNLESSELFKQSEVIGFVDCEELDDNSKIYFNGNLFKKENIEKTTKVLDSLNPNENRRVAELDSILSLDGCIALEKAQLILNVENDLLRKLQSIGMYEFNEVSNPKETKTFITKPSAFSKYGNPFEDDALDLAKAFVSSLYYGMNFSESNRGRISMLNALLRKLISGQEVGPATAIGQDYQILELKRVVELRREIGSNMYYMKLLKKDVGELALQVLEVGDTTSKTINEVTVYAGSINNYKGPEDTRRVSRKKQTPESKNSIAQILKTFRN